MRKLSQRQLIVISLLLFIVLNGILIFLMQKETKEEFYDSSGELVSQTAFALQYWIEDQIRLAKVMASDQRTIEFVLDPGDATIRRQVEEALMELNRQYTFYDTIPITLVNDQPVLTVVDGEMRTIENGQVLLDFANITNIGMVELPKADVEKILSGRPYVISELRKSALSDKIVFDISVPIKSEDQKIVGILTLSAKADYFTKVFVDNKRIGKTGYMFLLDEHGHVIAHQNRDFILNDRDELIAQTNEIIAYIDDGQNMFVDDFLGVRKFYYGEKVEIAANNTDIHNNYYIFIGQNWTETMDEVFTIAIWFFVLTLVTGALIVRVYVLMKESALRQRHEAELISMNQLLEEKVNERTKALKELAVTDGLTGLYNHRHSLELLSGKLMQSSPNETSFIVLLADIDHFKQVNDRYGHQMGDEVLKSVASIMRSAIRTTDFAGRYGGEEFIIVLNDCQKEMGIQIAEDIRTKIEANNYDGISNNITISIGLAQWTGQSVSEVIKDADQRLYKAKHSGRNRLVAKE